MQSDNVDAHRANLALIAQHDGINAVHLAGATTPTVMRINPAELSSLHPTSSLNNDILTSFKSSLAIGFIIYIFKNRVPIAPLLHKLR